MYGEDNDMSKAELEKLNDEVTPDELVICDQKGEGALADIYQDRIDNPEEAE